MRILFLIDGLGRGGMQRRFVQLVKGLNEHGYTDLFLINTRDIWDYKEILGYDIRREFMDRRARGFIFRFINRVKEIKPDIIQPWSDVDAAYANIAYCFCKKKPAYVSAFIADCNYFKHDAKSKVVMRWAYWLSRYVVSNSVKGLESYKVPQGKRKCIHNGFDFDRLGWHSDADIRKELGISTRFVVSMLARMQPNKDYPTYIRAACMVLAQRNDVTFLAVGGGELEEEYKAMVPIEHARRIIFTGKRDDIEAVLRASDLSVLCTNANRHGEGVSNSILEAMAFSLPVIATAGGGTAEIIDDGETGFIITPADSTALSEKVQALLNNDELRRRMGIASFEKIKNEFSLGYATQQYIDLYETLGKREK